MRIPLLLLLLSAALSACVSLPADREARGLYRDLRKTVRFQASSDWVVDRLEIEEARRSVMRSVCSSTPAGREALELWLASEIERSGGSAERIFRETGDVDTTLREMERVQLLFESASSVRGECPYWLEEDDQFAGVESDESRFVIFGETRGGGSLIITDGSIGFGGGGSGRLLLGYGIAPRLTLAVGGEVGADGVLPENEDGSRSFEALASIAVPLMLRITDIDRVVDLEVAYTQRFDETPRPGIRGTIGYGLTTPRVSGLMPYLVLWIGYQYTPSLDGLPAEHAISAGSRFGFNWDP